MSTFCTLTLLRSSRPLLLLQNRHSRVNASVDHQQQTTQSMGISHWPRVVTHSGRGSALAGALPRTTSHVRSDARVGTEIQATHHQIELCLERSRPTRNSIRFSLSREQTLVRRREESGVVFYLRVLRSVGMYVPQSENLRRAVVPLRARVASSSAKRHG